MTGLESGNLPHSRRDSVVTVGNVVDVLRAHAEDLEACAPHILISRARIQAIYDAATYLLNQSWDIAATPPATATITVPIRLETPDLEDYIEHLLARYTSRTQLGGKLCPHCGAREGVVNTREDVYECVTMRSLNHRGCGAIWRASRLGAPE